MSKIPVAVLGATGMVGQRFIQLLHGHPWFEVRTLAASPRSAGKAYKEAVGARWVSAKTMPSRFARMNVYDVQKDRERIAGEVRLAFCALDLDKEKIKLIEEQYAAAGVFVVSNNSAHRWTPDVPMILPEVNPHHTDIIPRQRTRRGWTTGGIVVKSNCSIQSYVPVLTALMKYGPRKITVTTLQAISGAGKTFARWPEMADNVIPFIGGEEAKSEREPLKVWGAVRAGVIKPARYPVISATCVRVAVSDGHMAVVRATFRTKPTVAQAIRAIRSYKNPIRKMGLPSAPAEFLTYFGQDDRPQTRLDRDRDHGMGISVGRLRTDPLADIAFVALSHNTIRGAAGGAILAAELLVKKGYV